MPRQAKKSPQGDPVSGSGLSRLSGLKRRLPWPVKVARKIALSRLPASARVWRWLGAFRHGAMQQPDYAYSVFTRHTRAAGLNPLPAGFTCLEIGPGDSLFSAVIAKAMGAERSYLVDVGRFAVDDSAHYRAMTEFLKRKGLAAPGLAAVASLGEVLEACGALYLAEGLRSLRAIPDSSCDLVWSHAVLEHIRRAEFPEVMQELHRIMKPTGIG